jgi:TRAP-type uncharacterized transport system substrate-binding protein
MKKLIVLLSLLFIASVGFCADQPQNIGYFKTDAPFGNPNYNLAAMNLLTAPTSGYYIFVGDALQSKVCVSSGTGIGAFVVASASSPFPVAGSYPHCQ